MLIQSLWRCYAADKSFHSDATWQIHVVGKDHHTNHQTGTQLGKVRRTDMILLAPCNRLEVPQGQREGQERGEVN